MKARDVKGTRSDRIVEQKGRVMPRTIYAKYEIWDAKDPYLEAAETIDKLVAKDQTVYVGEYRLVTVRKAKLNLDVR
jgi:hypothetical protein